MENIQSLDKIAKQYYSRAWENCSVSQQANVIAIQVNQIEIAKLKLIK